MLEQIGINERVAQQFMSIGGNPVLANTSNCAYLPKTERTLYELSRIPADKLQTAIESGRVTPQSLMD